MLLLFVILSPVFMSGSSTRTVVLVVSVDLIAVFLILALYNPKRFHWAGRVVTGMVFLGYLIYFGNEVASGKPWHFGRRSEETPINALLGLLAIGLPCLRYTIVGRLGGKTGTQHEDVTFRRWLTGPCPQCANPLRGHDWAMFATTVASEKNASRLTGFFNDIKVHNWRSVRTYSDWDPTQNDMEVYAVRCVSGGAIFVVRSPFEFWESDELYFREPISAAEMLELEALIPADSWQKGQSSAADGQSASAQPPLSPPSSAGTSSTR